MELERKDHDVPVPPPMLFAGKVRQPAEAPIHVGFTRIGDRANDVPPLTAELRKFLKAVPANEPDPFFVTKAGEVIVHVLPVAVTIKDFKYYIISHCHSDAGVKEVARVHHHRLAATLGFKRAQ